MTVGGDPAVINDVSVRLLDAEHELRRGALRIRPTFALTVVPDCPVEQMSPTLATEAADAVSALAGVLASDSYHLQRAAHELHEALNGPGEPPRFAPLPLPMPMPDPRHRRRYPRPPRFESPGELTPPPEHDPQPDPPRFESPGELTPPPEHDPQPDPPRFESPGELPPITEPTPPVHESPGVLDPTPLPAPRPNPVEVRPLPEPVVPRSPAPSPPATRPVSPPPATGGPTYTPAPPRGGMVHVPPSPSRPRTPFDMSVDIISRLLPDFSALKLFANPPGMGPAGRPPPPTGRNVAV